MYSHKNRTQDTVVWMCNEYDEYYHWNSPFSCTPQHQVTAPSCTHWAPSSSRPFAHCCRRKATGTWSWLASWLAYPTGWPTPSRPKVARWVARKSCRASRRGWPGTCSLLPSWGKQDYQPPPWSKPMVPKFGLALLASCRKLVGRKSNVFWKTFLKLLG